MRARVCTSSAANGSSISRTLGRMARARATATLWRMPPESSSGRFSIAALRPTRCRASSATDLRSALPAPRIDRPKLTFSQTVSQGKSEVSWKIRLRSGEGASTRSRNDQISPSVASSSSGDQVEQGALAAARRAEEEPRTRPARPRGRCRATLRARVWCQRPRSCRHHGRRRHLSMKSVGRQRPRSFSLVSGNQ